MSINPSPLNIALRCPICGEPIDALRRPGASEDEILEATHALVLMHVQSQHTMHAVLTALGTARNALMDLREATKGWAEFNLIEEDIARGLGNV